MARIIDPPRERLGGLSKPLLRQQRNLVDLFDQRLDRSWEIYVQPYLNGLEPDIVLLSPESGVAVFEMREWRLRDGGLWAEPGADGRLPKLMTRGYDGNPVSMERENPVTRVRRAKDEIYNVYCSGLPEQRGYGLITAGVIFPNASRRDVNRTFSGFWREDEKAYPSLYRLVANEDIRSGDMARVFPAGRGLRDRRITEAEVEGLRDWLRGPVSRGDVGSPLVLNERQRELARSRTAGGYRRVRGPAGSGKSVAVAARAAELSDRGDRVLVVCFNITLMNYLMDLTGRYGTDIEPVRRRVDFLNFHHWCRRVCEEAGLSDDYRELWRKSPREEVFNRLLPEMVQRVYSSGGLPGDFCRYDAILVDEGQDFSLLWWETLRLALQPGGEMLLVADKTQNIYGRAGAWTDEAMRGAGFSGPWYNLDVVYRMPSEMMPILDRYAGEFMVGEEVDVPSQMSLSGRVEFRWLQMDPGGNAGQVCSREALRQMKGVPAGTPYPDIVFITQHGEAGRGFARALEQRDVNLLHTFGEDKQESRRQKLAFRQRSPKLKATTLHSFKGWEARRLVIYVDSIGRPEDRALLYTALTRLKQDDGGSSLTVVSTCPELQEFGKTWPEYFELGSDGRLKRPEGGGLKSWFSGRKQPAKPVPERERRGIGRR